MRPSISICGVLLILISSNSLLLYCDQKNAEPSTTDESQAMAASDSAKPATTQSHTFLGNSLSAGYGLDPDLAFPARFSRK
jgi:hypothetical protein